MNQPKYIYAQPKTKKTATELAIEEASRVVSIDSSCHWVTYLPEFISRIQSLRSEVRMAGFHSLMELFCRDYRGGTRIDRDIDQILSSAVETLSSSDRNREFNLVSHVCCALAMTYFDNFEPFAPVYMNTVIPMLSQASRQTSFGFFAISFISSFAFRSPISCQNLVDHFYELIMNKKSRSTDFCKDVFIWMAHGLNILLSMYPTDYVISIRPMIEEIIDRFMESHTAAIIVAALKMIPVLAETVITEITDQSQQGAFIGKYRSKIANLHQNVTKNSDQKQIKTEVGKVDQYLSGSGMSETLTLYNQIVRITGPRHMAIVKSIRMVTTTHFQETMCTNTRIHELLGFQLMKPEVAQRMKKKFRKEIEQERVGNKRDREQAIAKRRRQKDDRMRGEDDD